MKKRNHKNPVYKAVILAGGQSALAKKCGVKQPTVFRWIGNGIVPPKKVLMVESITGISRYELNPFIYQRE